MNRTARQYLKDLQQSLSSLIEEQGVKLDTIEPENFIDDVNENILTKLDEVLYNIETIISDVEDGYYPEDIFEGDNDDFDEF